MGQLITRGMCVFERCTCTSHLDLRLMQLYADAVLEGALRHGKGLFSWAHGTYCQSVNPIIIAGPLTALAASSPTT